MKAMLLNKIYNLNENITPLEMTDIPQPVPSNDEILVKISTCGVCHTELDEIKGRTPPTHFPVIPGHQVVGYVKEMGKNVTIHKIGDRVGIAWIIPHVGNANSVWQEMRTCAPFSRQPEEMPTAVIVSI